ncbi:hypothetical protein [Streptomyces zingiberis]|uniref:Uncharacterized protein n=1 Tax=Streptomyces zingiberis TaxID=2053010 RepID=A0ABX1C0W0_9ACTN|nr:hypothetical protein [Streptomyces zingiberis]NJQ03554.1 hypothetical protein [Streptomyces zingiberis]
MPVSLVHPHRVTGRPPAPRIVRTAARCCAVCGLSHCDAPQACRWEYDRTEWLECPDCGGSGYDTTGFRIFCPICRGSKMLKVEIVEDAAEER